MLLAWNIKSFWRLLSTLILFIFATLLLSCGGGGGGGGNVTDNSSLPQDWSSYKARLDQLALQYQGRPTAINLSRIWFDTLQPNLNNFSTRIDKFQVNGSRNPQAGVGYGSFALLPNNESFVFYSNWALELNRGSAFALKYTGDVPTDLHYLPIKGATHSWVLDNTVGSQSVVFLGVDEGELFSQPDSPPTSPSYTFDLSTEVWDTLNFMAASHNSIPFDYDSDGDDDVVAQSWDDDGSWHAYGHAFYILKNDSGSFSPVPITNLNRNAGGLQGWLNGMCVAPLGFQSNGQFALFIGEQIELPEVNVAHQQNAIYYFSADLTRIEDALPLPFPYFERPEFSGIQSFFDESGVSYSHEVSAKALDVDKDGDLDLIVSSMIWSNTQPYTVLQVLINYNGTYVDETDSRLYNWSLIGGGAHRLDFLDINGDGFIDILASDHGPAFESDFSLTSGSRVLVNDGTGNFLTVIHQQINDQDVWPSFVPSLNSQGLLRWTSFYTDGSSTVKVITRMLNMRLSTGPNMANPASLGAPGFNEFYYLLHNPDVVSAIEASKYASGLDHFLALGRTEGRRSYAEGAVI